MAKVLNHMPLFSTDLKYFKSVQIIEGKTIFDRYNSLANIIKNNVDTAYQDFISYPVIEGNKIEFQGKLSIEEPQILSDLSASESLKYQALKNDTITFYQNKIEALKNAGKTEESIFLASAIKYVDDRFIYCYDNKVVLGAWGMQLRENVREDLSEIRKNLINKKSKKNIVVDEDPIQEPVSSDFENVVSETPLPMNPYTIHFDQGNFGTIRSQNTYAKYSGESIYASEIPHVEPNDGYEFIGWSENPHNYNVQHDKTFTAQYREKLSPLVTPPKLPWWKRLWNWLVTLFTGKGCLKWLLWLLLLLLLLLLFSWLFRGCNSHLFGGGINHDDRDGWHQNYPGDGVDNGDNHEGIYDPNNPYQPAPTPPDYKDILPPEQGVLPPIDANPEIIPGNPSIIANRLNILMENEDKSILDFAREFKTKYADDKYKIIYYDDVVKRLQIEVPKEEREKLKQEIPGKFTPEYEVFVFDEAMFEGAYQPSDPAFADPNKTWYLNTTNALKAWDITKGSEKITVAIVDNGFNLQHPELSNKVVKPYNVWSHSKEIFPQKVDHGTHVAGTAIAIANNGKGICGIAPNCKFMPVQVGDRNGNMTTSAVLDGILYALYQGADVVNVSLGNQFTGLSRYPENEQQDLINNHFKEEERLWFEISRIASKHKSTIVVAAGNDNVLAGIDALQRPDNFIVVSAIDKKSNSFGKSNFSNYGKFSTVSAPGVGIYSCIGNNNYMELDGTSMAAPIVTGAVALMKSINDSLTSKQIKCILQSTGLETKGNIGSLIQIDKALLKVKSKKEVECTPTPTSGDVQMLLSWDNYNDLDLLCKDPEGEMVYFKNRSVTSGGELEFDMNVEFPDSKHPTENIYWPNGKAPRGTYEVYLLYYKQHTPIKDTPYKITVKHGDKVENYKGIIRTESEHIQICTFTY